jgi:hypothetical protein
MPEEPKPKPAVCKEDFLLDIYFYRKELETARTREEANYIQERINEAERLYCECCDNESKS